MLFKGYAWKKNLKSTNTIKPGGNYLRVDHSANYLHGKTCDQIVIDSFQFRFKELKEAILNSHRIIVYIYVQWSVCLVAFLFIRTDLSN